MNAVWKKVEMYRVIATVLERSEFNESLAERAVWIHGEIKGEGLLLSELSVDFLRQAHRGNHGMDPEPWQLLQQLVEIAFADLARQLRMPVVWWVFERLRQMIDADHCDLFVRVVNIRRLGEGRGGASVITLVVDSHEKFQQYLWNWRAVEKVHSLEGRDLDGE